ncbi:biliverdin-producing heme oxygenase [Neisseriaceae bacterium PsAf]|nr:biliverdin-producing heme oxygenase [Neisseriaceae bacterium PsAf]MCV2503551.1 biliverdin-producing heme oxygenase [Neisseriaceae bacterium]
MFEYDNVSETSPLVEVLKRETRSEHEKVDNLINSLEPFLNEYNYGKFLQLQEIFHKIVNDIYLDSELNSKIPDLKDLARYEKVKQDMQDLGVSSFESDNLPKPERVEAIGWLYCAEGSNLGAAFLLKDAKNIGMNENYGARHLAPHPDGRGKHWREFSKVFNTVTEDEETYQQVVQGAKKAFEYYAQLAKQVFETK